MDPNPYKGPDHLLTKIRDAVESELLAAGFRPGTRSRRGPGRLRFLDFERPGHLLSLSWDAWYGRLAAELLPEDGSEIDVIATTEFEAVRSTADLESRLGPFIAAVRSRLAMMRKPADLPHDPSPPAGRLGEAT